LETEAEKRLPSGVLVKVRLLKQRACNEKNDKGKLCAGHLKRWYRHSDEVRAEFGPDAELYRCEKCRTIYLPNLEEEARTGTLRW
jgi:uncharacterized protein with PIN domain